MVNIFKYIRIRYFLLLFLLVIVASLYMSMTPEVVYSSEPIEICKVYVEQGDTLWEIAAEYNYNNIDMRDLVMRISELNGLEGSKIYPGQVLEVPILQ